ncbi:MAG: site-2 protease family protein, partial [Planctomycetota bacterium]|nr:site-2 protease family protein [Planctomycetota bacterium]
DEEGEPIGDEIVVEIPVTLELQILRYPELNAKNSREFDYGLLGLLPLIQITEVMESSPNHDVLEAGDYVLRLADVDGPPNMRFRKMLQESKGKTIDMDVLRDGEVKSIQVHVNRKGQLGILISMINEEALIAQPMNRITLAPQGNESGSIVSTSVADLMLMPGTKIKAINERTVDTWTDLWVAFREETNEAYAKGEGVTLAMLVTHPTPQHPQETMDVTLSEQDVRDLHDLQWQSDLNSIVFDSIYTIRTADGDPMKALAMGVEETKKLIMMTYLTIDRLIRRTVGVEQLRGPVCIIHIGVSIVDRGFIYMLFFLGMISVNLAVINFLPLPIVDGGLFLFLIYEKLKGKPPSIAFQSAATIVGLCLIGTIFIVTFYNDVMRLIS